MTFIDIDGADYVELQYKGSTYYIGEEVILDSDQNEFGWICARGNMVAIAATDSDGKTIAQRTLTGDAAEALETDGDIIDAINALR